MQHLVADHLTGEQIGEIAAEAEVKKVILTHFSPGSDGETNLDSYAAGISRSFRGDVILGRDLDEFCFSRLVDLHSENSSNSRRTSPACPDASAASTRHRSRGLCPSAPPSVNGKPHKFPQPPP